MSRRDQASILDIKKAATRAQSFVKDTSWEVFEKDIKTQSAVLYQIAILGEAVKRLSSEFRSQYPNVPWSQIAGMRDKLVHDYDGTDFERIWGVLNSDIPELLKAVETILKG